jgi:phosphoribosylanthranilate isomerase
VTRVKVCGIRRPEDAALAVELGATALGFIFWPSSPRYVEPDRARAIVESLSRPVLTVGVFVDQGVAHVSDVARSVKLDAVQLHGQERVEDYRALRSEIGMIKAVAVGENGSAEDAVSALPPDVIVLLDAHDPVKRGGTGRTIDWTRAAAMSRTRELILSGGLTADNVGKAVAAVRPYAVDVSSGVESAPGVKDPDKLRRFFDAVGFIGKVDGDPA